jgi:hypothetical protein
MKQKKKPSLLLHGSKNGSITKQTRLVRDLAGNLAGDLVANKLDYCSKTNLIGDIEGDLSDDLTKDIAGELVRDLVAKKICYIAKTDFTEQSGQIPHSKTLYYFSKIIEQS